MKKSILKEMILAELTRFNENKPDKEVEVAEPDTDTQTRPTRRRTLRPPKHAPDTKPKAKAKVNEENIIAKLVQKYRDSK